MEVFTTDNGLTFEETDPITGEPCHLYKLDGKRVISLTQLLDACGLVDYSGVPMDTLRAKAKFGTKVHEMALWADQGDLDLEDLRPYPDYEARILGWLDFCKDYDFQPDLAWCERPMAVKLNGCLYAMKIDRFGMTNQGYAVIEIKTSCDLQYYYDIQTAGQMLAFRNELRPVVKRFIVQLLDKPTAAGKRYFCKECTERQDEKVFLACLLLTQTRVNHKLLK